MYRYRSSLLLSGRMHCHPAAFRRIRYSAARQCIAGRRQIAAKLSTSGAGRIGEVSLALCEFGPCTACAAREKIGSNFTLVAVCVIPCDWIAFWPRDVVSFRWLFCAFWDSVVLSTTRGSAQFGCRVILMPV